MAGLRRIIEVANVTDAKAVEEALKKVQATCASGLAAGPARLVIEFEAPDVQTRRRVGAGDDEEENEPARVAKAPRAVEKASG